MKIFLLRCAKAALRFIYFFMKLLLPVKNRITFISRQGNEAGLDFTMLRAELEKSFPQYELVTLCRTVPKEPIKLVGYCFHILTQMRCIAGSRLVVLDSYCIPASVLRHRPQLRVIQLWHALGAFKRFGLSVAGQSEGSDERLAAAMDMHKNYSFAICSGERCVPCFAEAFGMSEKKLLPIGLPRMDYLTQSNRLEQRELVRRQYPALSDGKKTILYVPTFRRANGENDYELRDATALMASSVELSRYNLIIKTHSGDELVYAGGEIARGNGFLGMELLFAADFVITDYSSIVFEAALAGVPIYLWCYDRESYANGRGFYLDYPKDIPAFCSGELGEVLSAIDRCERPSQARLEGFVQSFVSRTDGSVCRELAALCDRLARGGGETCLKSQMQ